MVVPTPPTVAEIDRQIADLAPDIHRGAEAKRFLEHPLLRDALARIERGIHTSFEEVATGPPGPEQAERYQMLGMKLRVLNDFKTVFNAVVQTGAMAEADSANLESQRMYSREFEHPVFAEAE